MPVIRNRFAVAVSTLLLLSLGVHAAQSHAFASVVNEDGSSFADFNGALRLNAGYAHSDSDFYSQDTDQFMTTSVVRFISVGTIAERLDFELDAFGVSGSVPVAAGASLTHAGLTRSTYRTSWLSDGAYRTSVYRGYGLDRAFVRITGDRANLSMGRMPVNYSIAGLFSVNDFFAPFSATSINTVYKPGVDAAKLAIQTGDMSNIELVGVAGYDIRDDEAGTLSGRHSAFLMYAHRLLGPVDVSLTTGRLATKWMVGVSAQGDIGPISLYGEGHFAYFDDTDQRLRKTPGTGEKNRCAMGTAGLRWMTDWRNLTVTVEYAYLSNGVTASEYGFRYAALALHPDEFPYAGKQYAGISASMELHPLLYLSGVTVMNILDTSVMGSLALGASIGDNAEWLTGAIFAFGDEMTVSITGSTDNSLLPIDIHSEFGDMPFTAFTELRYYF